MNKRIAEIRKSLGMSQQSFAESLSLSRNFVCLVENGSRVFSERTIKYICKEYNVNETWLRTGKGTMYSPITREQEIGSIAASIIKEYDPIKMQLEKIILSLTKDQVETLYEIAKKVVDAKEDAD